ncbi:MAG: transposase [Methanoregula sp.]|nr:MAG: transposase [Methanoregula sp.]
MKGKVIEFHSAMISGTRWIGVDLNTTGHVAVAADPLSGKVMKLGKNAPYIHSHCLNNCTKLIKSGKFWKLKKLKSRERSIIKGVIHTISRQIVSFAESVGSGIKFEKLFSPRHDPTKESTNYFEFSFDNASFFHLQRQVERKAKKAGIPVIYVNPAYTSKRCSRCGGFGRRYRKRFECPHCGFVVHADVNAAFNIATASFVMDAIGAGSEMTHERIRLSKKQVRRLTRTAPVYACSGHGMFSSKDFENLLYVLECHDQQVQCTPS